MTELERVKEFMDTLEFHGYIDHDLTKLDQLIEDYYPLKQGQTLPLDSVSERVIYKWRERHDLLQKEFKGEIEGNNNRDYLRYRIDGYMQCILDLEAGIETFKRHVR